MRSERKQSFSADPFHRTTLETTLGQTAPPESGGILRGCPLLAGAICPNVVSRVGARCSPVLGAFKPFEREKNRQPQSSLCLEG